MKFSCGDYGYTSAISGHDRVLVRITGVNSDKEIVVCQRVDDDWTLIGAAVSLSPRDIRKTNYPKPPTRDM